MKKPLAEGEKAPEFILRVGNGDMSDDPKNFVDSQKLKGRNTILSFYPADFSPVCSSQIALYNELIPTFKEYNADVYGISVDGTYCHQAFKKDNNLSIELWSDFQPKGEVAKKFNAYNDTMGVCERAIYVLDSDGVIRYSYISPMGENPGAKEILETLKEINNK